MLTEKFFRVEPRVFEVLPRAVFGVVVARGIDNQGPRPGIQEELARAMEGARSRFAGTAVRESREVRPYRKAFEALGINPNKFQSSIEAMLARIAKGGTLPNINPVVDLVNSVSLKFGVPMGSHDLDTLDAGIEVRFSVEGDHFTPFGSEEREVLAPGELVYVSGHEVRTRRWIWRQSDRGKTTEKTRDLFFPVDGFSGEDGNLDQVLAARDELAARVRAELGAEATTGFVNADHREFKLN